MKDFLLTLVGIGIGFCFGWHCSYIHTINQEDMIVADGINLEKI